ncbi:ABC transporter substrate-binding protein [Streptomyces indicus]|uniref:Polar amino acid transport system substrate-binding protein n=1 Tax=Streptomyces indicus TaxID=417292 RepID=A0A1G8UXW3_9ACTN|nr:ABC transporter substrate-binding protein [Streptomyces indicus]SDJ58702.1 polar amino acid transport system substrate-binding protein [Streptomyces indicus]
MPPHLRTPSSAASARRAAGAVALAAGLAFVTACGSGDDADAGSAKGKGDAPMTVAGATVEKDEALHDALPAAIRDAGTLRVASDVPYPPFEMFVQEGGKEITGLDYDLAQALGGKLGVDIAFTPQKFDGIIPAIQAGKFDLAISAMTDNKQRQKVVDFVDYSVSGTGILVREGNPEKVTTALDLCGLKVAAQAATNQADFVKEQQAECSGAGKPKIELQTYPKDSDTQLAVSSGKADAAVITKPAAGYIAKTVGDGSTFDLVDDPAAKGGYNASPNGIAVSKKHAGLADTLQKALQQLMDEGTYKKILDKYGVASIGLDKATKNAAVD